jgi:glycosyltransferase involved in cell wall biosynthesis
MRVLLTADPVGGVWTFALELTQALSRRGVEVVVASMGRRLAPEQREELDSCAAVAAYASDYALEWMDDPWGDVERAGEWLLQIRDEVTPDVVHLSSYVHAALPWRVPAVVTAHSCVLSWYEAVRHEAAPPAWQRYAHAVERGLQHADAIVAPTRAMLDALDRHYRFGAARHVIPNGRSSRTFGPRAKEPFVLAAGRLWDEAKNSSGLDAAAASLRWPVKVAGEIGGPDGNRPWPRHLELLGRVEQRALADAYARAAVFVAAARYEPFGLAALEAALCGCALVLGDIESLHEVWREAALYVDPESPEAIRTAIACLIDDPQLRWALGAAALRRARTFTPERMAASYHRLYDEVLHGAEPHRDVA